MEKISKERLGALSDGVISIAATLLVLGLTVPDGDPLSSDVLFHWMRIFAGWAISFTVIAIVWFDNHFLLAQTTHLNLRLARYALLQLAMVSLIPFAADLVTEYSRNTSASLAFNGIMLANGLSSAVISLHVARAPELHIGAHVAAIMKHRAQYKAALYITIAVVAALGAWKQHPFIGVALWVLSPLTSEHVLHRWINRFVSTVNHKAAPPAA